MEQAMKMAKAQREELGSRPLSGVDCNESPARYWALTGFDDAAAITVCNEINREWMFALVTFHGEGKISFSISQKTWERGEGHYPTVIQLCGALAKDPRLSASKGSFIVWLEDGMWDWCKHYSRRAPIMAFGRSKNDTTTFLIPDPAFVGGMGYAQEERESKLLRLRTPWSERRPTIFWRGAATGTGIEGPEWVDTARGMLARKAREIGDASIVDAKITRIKHLPPENALVLESQGVVDREVPFDSFFTYKYIVDADGYHCAWKSLFLKLMTGSVVLKMDSPFEQWYHRDLVPWKHYIPLSRDLAELKDLHAWLRAHDSEAQAIANQGGEFISQVTLEATVDHSVRAIERMLGARRAP
jgi:hypothetical protein